MSLSQPQIPGMPNVNNGTSDAHDVLGGGFQAFMYFARDALVPWMESS